MRRFNWGISTLGCPELSLREAVALADEYDIRFLELRMLSGSLDLPAELAKEENRAAMRELCDAGRCRVLGSSFGLCSRQNDYEALLALGKVADEFGVPYLRVFGGFDFQEELDADRIAAARENLDWFRAQGLKARLALETHDGCSSAVRCRKLMDSLGEEVPVVWDAHHTYRFAGELFRESWEILARLTVDIHIKESRRGESAKGIATIPGDGDLPMEELFELLEEAEYKEPLTFEYEKKWEPYLPDMRIALEAMKIKWRYTE